ncbi:MAG TPA: hypothetical protein VH951_03050 [Dehalococcoidia bacterium]
MDASRGAYDNKRVLIAGAAVWVPLLLPVLFPLIEVIGGNTGYIVMVIVLSVPAGIALTHIAPYARDFVSTPVTVEGGVTEKRHGRRYFVVPRHEVVLDVDAGARASLAVGAAMHQAAGGALPEVTAINTTSGRTLAAFGGSSVDKSRRDAAASAGAEISTNLYELPKSLFDDVDADDFVRIHYYPRSRVTAGLERYDARVRRWVRL